MHTNKLIGRVFCRLTVIDTAGTDGKGNAKWRCRCDCGNETEVLGCNLLKGHTHSCGCLKLEQILARTVTHGCTRGKKTLEYNSWRSAKGRCFNVNKNQYEDYGGRGIVMCNRWASSFEAFLEDLGHRPSPSHTLDRIDNDGHYSCGKCPECVAKGWKANCRWATRKEQAANARKRKLRVA
jgi:hypothetical protein